VTIFERFACHLPGRTEENHEIFQSRQVISESKFDADLSIELLSQKEPVGDKKIIKSTLSFSSTKRKACNVLQEISHLSTLFMKPPTDLQNNLH
jgi:hypothetical protein